MKLSEEEKAFLVKIGRRVSFHLDGLLFPPLAFNANQLINILEKRGGLCPSQRDKVKHERTAKD